MYANKMKVPASCKMLKTSWASDPFAKGRIVHIITSIIL